MKKTVSVLLALVLALCACAPAMADFESANRVAAEAAAKLPEDARFVNIFNWTYYIPDEVLEEFESATGIRVNYSPFSSNEEMLGAIGYALGQYDLMVSSDYAVAALIENGYLTQIDPARLENYKNINPAFMGQYFDPDNAYSIPYTSVFPLIAYNPDEVSVEIPGL